MKSVRCFSALLLCYNVHEKSFLKLFFSTLLLFYRMIIAINVSRAIVDDTDAESVDNQKYGFAHLLILIRIIW